MFKPLSVVAIILYLVLCHCRRRSALRRWRCLEYCYLQLYVSLAEFLFFLITLNNSVMRGVKKKGALEPAWKG
jgi:hypothetical protein